MDETNGVGQGQCVGPETPEVPTPVVPSEVAPVAAEVEVGKCPTCGRDLCVER